MPKFTIKTVEGNRARTTTGEILRVPVNNRPLAGQTVEYPDAAIVTDWPHKIEPVKPHADKK